MSWKADNELDTIDCKLQQKRTEDKKIDQFSDLALPES